MIFRDFVTIASGNLWRMKLRAGLTVSGIVIAIAAFVSMLSFGAGMEAQVTSEFNKLGLFTTMQVYPPRDSNDSTSVEKAVLDGEAVEAISGIPGVLLAYPFDKFDVTVAIGDTEVSTQAQALPDAALRTKLFSQFEAGASFESDSARQVVVTEQFLELIGVDDPDSVIGKEIILSVAVASIDSGLFHIIKEDEKFIWEEFDEIRFDSLFNSDYRGRFLRDELSGAAGRFVDGFLNARSSVSDTMTITGVLEHRRGRSRMRPVIIPVATGQKISSAGFTGDLASLMSTLASGGSLLTTGEQSGKSYSRVTIDMQHDYPYASIRDSIESLGYRVFSYAEEFEEIRKVFTFFYLGLGVVGFIALAVASLGIINTMIMAITERRREIGVLRSLGADGRDIKLLFLVESALIGAGGSLIGILAGWITTRLITVGANIYMEEHGVDPIDMFALPFWLIVTAFCFGLLVSLAAGYYPSSRAARVDPVQALRGD